MSTVSRALDEHVYLIGRPPVSQYLSYMRRRVAAGFQDDEAEWTETWRRAQACICELQSSEAGIADQITPAALPDELQALAAARLHDPVLVQSAPLVPWRWAWLELDKLVVYQKYVDLTHAARLRAELQALPAQEALARFCFGMDRKPPAVQVTAHQDGSYSFHSPSTDLRCLDVVRVAPEMIRELRPSGHAMAAVCVLIGYGSNVLTALQFKQRLILGNGTHHAYALRAQGFTHAPFLIADISREEDFELAAMPEVKQNPAWYLHNARPPLFKDYFDSRLHQRLCITREHTSVQVRCSVQLSRYCAF